MPVTGVRVDEIMGDRSKGNWTIAELVKTQLATSSEITVQKLVPLVLTGTKKERSVEQRIRRNGDAIAILAGAWFVRGKRGVGGEANRFVREPSRTDELNSYPMPEELDAIL